MSSVEQESSSVPGFQQAGFSIPPIEQGFPGSGGFVDTSIPVVPKRLIVCCDGTWQSSVTGLKNVPSNVTRLTRSIARSGRDKDNQVWQQLVYYDAGIGTGDLSTAEKDRQGGFGIGFVGNVIEAYNFLVLNYAPGDEIFCFGFSRGAYTARAVAGLVNDIGIISPRDMQDFPDLYAAYQKNVDSQGFRKSAAYREWVNGVLAQEQPPKTEGGFQPPPVYSKPAHRPAPEASRVVQVVGVFDTVGSLGIPDMTWTRYNLKFMENAVGIPKVGFHNVALSPYIKHAFHALALDEHRGPFSPTLWHYPAKSTHKKPEKSHADLWSEWSNLHSNKNSTEAQLQAAWSALVDREMWDHLKETDSDLLQVWFPGVHINIGGGSDDLLSEALKGDFEQIALITFAWMCEQAAPYLQLDGDLGTVANATVEDRSSLVSPVLRKLEQGGKDYGSNWAMKIAWKTLDKTGVKKAQLKKVALGVVNGWATGPIVDSFTGSMAVAGSITRTPGRYSEAGFGATNEMIHPCVKYRMKKDETYKPLALAGFKRDLLEEKKNGYVWTKEKVAIPEYIIKPGDYFTRHVALQDSLSEDGASDFIGQIDRDMGAKTFEAETLDIREENKKSRGVSQ